MIKTKETSLGVRISDRLKKSMDMYCQSQGISRKRFVERAIKDMLIEMRENEQDLRLAKKRLSDEIVSEREMEAYFAKRLKEK